MLSASIFELLSLNIMYQMLNYFSDNNNATSKILEYISNLPSSYSIETYLIILFFLVFFIKTVLYLIYFKRQTFLKLIVLKI